MKREEIPEALAHVDEAARAHRLDDHLVAVGNLAADFASAFGAADWARLAGLWHDLGKYREGFQRYIRQSRDPDSHIEGKVGGRDRARIKALPDAVKADAGVRAVLAALDRDDGRS